MTVRLEIKDVKLAQLKIKGHQQKLRDQKVKISEEIDRLKDESFQVLTSAIMLAATNGDIAINSDIASMFRHRSDLSNEHKEDLSLYINACDAYKELQNSFSAFYNSEVFKVICKEYEKGENLSQHYSIPRLANSDYRPNQRKWWQDEPDADIDNHNKKAIEALV